MGTRNWRYACINRRADRRERIMYAAGWRYCVPMNGVAIWEKTKYGKSYAIAQAVVLFAPADYLRTRMNDCR